LLIIAFSMMALYETRLLLTTAFGIMGFGMGLAAPGLMAGVSLAVSSREQGAVAGLAASCGPLGFTIGPIIGGAIYQYDPRTPYLFAALIYILLFVFMQTMAKDTKSGHL
jgi:MFS family permease